MKRRNALLAALVAATAVLSGAESYGAVISTYDFDS